MTQELIRKLEAIKTPNDIETIYQRGYNEGVDKAIEVIRGDTANYALMAGLGMGYLARINSYLKGFNDPLAVNQVIEGIVSDALIELRNMYDRMKKEK